MSLKFNLTFSVRVRVMDDYFTVFLIKGMFYNLHYKYYNRTDFLKRIANLVQLFEVGIGTQKVGIDILKHRYLFENGRLSKNNSKYTLVMPSLVVTTFE